MGKWTAHFYVANFTHIKLANFTFMCGLMLVINRETVFVYFCFMHVFMNSPFHGHCDS